MPYSSRAPQLLLALAALAWASPARAQTVESPARHRITHEMAMAARYNPLGLFAVGNVSFKERLFESDSLALMDNHVGVGLEGTMSPAFGRVGLRAEVQPLTILRLTAVYLYGGYFGALGHLQSFVSPDEAFSDSTIDDLEESADPTARNYATAGHQATFTARLQLKVSGFVIRNTFAAQWNRYDLRAADTVYYDPVLDTSVENGGWALTNDLDGMWLFEGTGLLAGVRYNWTAPMYSDAAWAGDANGVRTHDNVMHRVGPLVGYTFPSPSRAFENPTLILLLNWYATHRHRTGDDVSRAVPYIGLAFLARGTLWSRDDGSAVAP